MAVVLMLLPPPLPLLLLLSLEVVIMKGKSSFCSLQAMETLIISYRLCVLCPLFRYPQRHLDESLSLSLSLLRRKLSRRESKDRCVFRLLLGDPRFIHVSNENSEVKRDVVGEFCGCIYRYCTVSISNLVQSSMDKENLF